MGAGQLGGASKAGGYVGRRPMGAQGRRLGVGYGSLAISIGRTGPRVWSNSDNPNLMHHERLTMHEAPPIPFFDRFPRLARFEGIISG